MKPILPAILKGLTMDYGDGARSLEAYPDVESGKTLPELIARRGQHYLTSATQEMSAEQLRTLWGPTVMHALLAARTLGFPDINAREPDLELKEYAHFMLRWGLYGFPNFQLTHGFAASLILTDCGKVRASELKFPFSSFLVTLPCPESPLAILHPEQGLIEVRWLFFHTIQAPVQAQSEQVWADYYRRISYPNSDPVQSFVAAVAQLREDYEWETMHVVRLVTADGLTVFRRVLWHEGEAVLAPWIGARDEDFEGLGMYDMDDVDVRATHAALRLIANLSLYLVAQPQTMVSRLARKPMRKDRDPAQCNPITTFVVGKDIKLSKELRDAARDFVRKGTKHAGWTLQSRHVVRGHWKQQVKGPGALDRARIWIHPYWRGEELATAVERRYTIDVTKESG